MWSGLWLPLPTMTCRRVCPVDFAYLMRCSSICSASSTNWPCRSMVSPATLPTALFSRKMYSEACLLYASACAACCFACSLSWCAPAPSPFSYAWWDCAAKCCCCSCSFRPRSRRRSYSCSAFEDGPWLKASKVRQPCSTSSISMYSRAPPSRVDGKDMLALLSQTSVLGMFNGMATVIGFTKLKRNA